MSDQDVQLVIRAANGLAARMEADLKEARAEIRRLTRERDEATRKALEEAAKVAEHPYSDAVMAFGPDEPFAVGRKIAAAIRALKETKP